MTAESIHCNTVNMADQFPNLQHIHPAFSELTEKKFTYQELLTRKLDALDGDFTQETINEIIL